MSYNIKPIPILLFIVVLVILYLIVNRKNQIKEGFFNTVLTTVQDQELATKILNLFKDLFKEDSFSDASDITIVSSVSSGKPGRVCRHGFEDDAVRTVKSNLYNTIKTKIDNINSNDNTTYKNITDTIKRAIFDSYTHVDLNTAGAKTGDIIGDNAVVTPFYYMSEANRDKQASLWCKGYSKLSSITYNARPYNDIDDLFDDIRKESFVVAEEEGKEAAIATNTAEAIAKRSIGATEAKNALVKSKIEAYINFLKENDFFKSVVIYHIMINSPPSNLSTLETDLFDKMVDYYKKNIENKAYNIETSCSTPSTDYNKSQCEEIGNIYGDYYLNEDIQT